MNLEISREERRLLLHLLMSEEHLRLRGDEAALCEKLMDRLLDPPGTLYSSPVTKPLTPDAEQKCPQPVVHQTAGESATDRRASGTTVKSGALPPVPAGAEELICTPLSLKNVGKRIVLGTAEHGYGIVSCWKSDLFDAVRARLNKPTTFYVVRKDKYLNIVGIKP